MKEGVFFSAQVPAWRRAAVTTQSQSPRPLQRLKVWAASPCPSALGAGPTLGWLLPALGFSSLLMSFHFLQLQEHGYFFLAKATDPRKKSSKDHILKSTESRSCFSLKKIIKNSTPLLFESRTVSGANSLKKSSISYYVKLLYKE